jgi:putative ABC transport system permease protein
MEGSVKYFPLIWAGLWRKKTRTIFTLLSILVAFLLFGLLQGVNAAFNGSVEGANVNRLYVQSKIHFTEPLPYADLPQIEAVPGVTKVAYATWFGPYYQDPQEVIFCFPVDPERYLGIYPEMKLPKDQLQAFIQTRTGAVVSDTLAKKYNWKIGDRVPLKSTIWTKKSDGNSDWTFDIVGIMDTSATNGFAPGFLFNYSYFDEARNFGNGMVGWYIVQIADPNHSAAIADTIDKLFENSTYETKTQNEKENAQSFLKQQGDINLIMTLIICAVFFTLLFLTGNTMMQSVRERIPEFAVLKTLGYSGAGVTAIILSEALLLSLMAALIGLAIAWSIFPLMQGVIGVARMPSSVLILGVAIAVLMALVTAAPPAWRLQRLKLVDALAGR